MRSARTLAKWEDVVGRKQSDAPLAGRKRSLEDVHSPFDPEALSNRPDGLIFDLQERVMYLVEIARTGDEEGSLRNRHIQKTLKYTLWRPPSLSGHHLTHAQWNK